MAYPDDGVVQTWLDAWEGLNIRLKKMFGCYCVYCDGQAVGWLSGSTFSLREVGLDYLPGRLNSRPSGRVRPGMAAPGGAGHRRAEEKGTIATDGTASRALAREAVPSAVLYRLSKCDVSCKRGVQVTGKIPNHHHLVLLIPEVVDPQAVAGIHAGALGQVAL